MEIGAEATGGASAHHRTCLARLVATAGNIAVASFVASPPATDHRDAKATLLLDALFHRLSVQPATSSPVAQGGLSLRASTIDLLIAHGCELHTSPDGRVAFLEALLTIPDEPLGTNDRPPPSVLRVLAGKSAFCAAIARDVLGNETALSVILRLIDVAAGDGQSRYRCKRRSNPSSGVLRQYVSLRKRG
jgi:hypothetical protein